MKKLNNNKPEAKLKFLPALGIEDKPGNNKLSFRTYIVIGGSVLVIIALLFNAIFVTPFQIEEPSDISDSNSAM
jgi:hypothetical protein